MIYHYFINPNIYYYYHRIKELTKNYNHIPSIGFRNNWLPLFTIQQHRKYIWIFQQHFLVAPFDIIPLPWPGSITVVLKRGGVGSTVKEECLRPRRTQTEYCEEVLAEEGSMVWQKTRFW